MFCQIFRTTALLLPVFFLASLPAHAQSQSIDLGTSDAPLPNGRVGVPYEFSFGFENLDLGDEGVTVRFTQSGGTIPPGLSVRGNGGIGGTPTTAGTYRFDYRFSASFSDEGFTFEVFFTFRCTVIVEPAGPQQATGITVEPDSLQFYFIQGAPASTVPLSLRNAGSVARTTTVSATTSSGGNWLSVTGGGNVSAFSRITANVSANPAGLTPGVYLGQVQVRYGNETVGVGVSMIVTGNQPRLVLSQTGFTFRSVAGVSTTSEQSLQVINAGPGAIEWASTATTLSGGAWLTTTPSSGSATGVAPSTLRVRISTAGLAAGEYHGQVEVRASGVPNSPQVVSVLLNVLPANANPSPDVSTTGLVFVARQGGAAPAPQSVRISGFTQSPVPIRTSTYIDPFPMALTATAAAPNVSVTAPVDVTVRVDATRFNAGVYRGEVTVAFSPGLPSRKVDVLLIVLPRLATTAARQAEGCTPTRLLPVFTALGAGFQGTAGWPTPVELLVVDDCGDRMTSGSVTISFSTGDSPLSMNSLRDGRWTGTWQARTPDGRQVVLTATAQMPAPALTGSAQIGGLLAQSTGTPAIAPGGALNAASFVKQAPVAPGGMIAIFGSGLSTGLRQATELPLRTELDGTRVLIGGRPLPLIFTSQGQVNALIPLDLTANTSHQLLVRRGTAYSLPETVVVAPAQPAIFTKNQRGDGAGIIVGVKADGRQFLVDETNRVSSGDVLVIYCAGLGAVDAQVAPGEPSPSTPVARTVAEVTAIVDGKAAQVLFAGLVPGFVGLYQVNAIVPQGVGTGTQMPVILSVGTQSSPPVTIAVE